MHAHGFQGAANPRNSDAEFIGYDVHWDVLAIPAQEFSGLLPRFFGDGKTAQMSPACAFGTFWFGQMLTTDLLGDGVHRAGTVSVSGEDALTIDRQRTISGPDEFREPLLIFGCPNQARHVI